MSFLQWVALGLNALDGVLSLFVLWLITTAMIHSPNKKLIYLSWIASIMFGAFFFHALQALIIILHLCDDNLLRDSISGVIAFFGLYIYGFGIYLLGIRGES